MNQRANTWLDFVMACLNMQESRLNPALNLNSGGRDRRTRSQGLVALRFRHWTRVMLALLPLTVQMSMAAPVKPLITVPDLEIQLIAAEPRIVTPIGMAFNPKGQLFVVESHTHLPRTNYAGPKYDRVIVFEDTNSDGLPDEPEVFAEGLHFAFAPSFAPNGDLFLVHRNGVTVLRDNNKDNKCDEQLSVLEMETEAKFPHNGLGAIAFGPDGWLYVGLGENMGADYVLKAKDGTAIRGGRGEGVIFRCRPDGTELAVFAKGFWNLFGMEFDGVGRLFAVDNDPGGRPPCRLLHIIPHGDYGYKRYYPDLHPFNGWNGELPGTLPMLAATGESPCGLLDTDRLALPRGYQGSLLVASWGDHSIELYRLRPKGASFTAERQVLVQGERKFNEAFCPVALAAAPDGSVYVSDWADRTAYSVHGKGRIWRLSAKPDVKVTKSGPGKPTHRLSSAERRLLALVEAENPREFTYLRNALSDKDPFVRSAAVTGLAKPVYKESLLNLTEDSDPSVRLGAFLALRRESHVDAEPRIRKALNDADTQVRFYAMLWAAEGGHSSLAGELKNSITVNPSSTLFGAYLAANELMSKQSPGGNPEMQAAKSRDQILTRILHDDEQPTVLRAMAVAAITAPTNATTIERLIQFARSGDVRLRIETIRTLATSPDSRVSALLLEIARDTTEAAELRAEAIHALSRGTPNQLPKLLTLLDDKSPKVQVEVARALRMWMSDSLIRQALLSKLGSVDLANYVRDQFGLALRSEAALTTSHRSIVNRPASPEEWHNALAKDGDAASGWRVFFSPLLGCAKCHHAQGRGATVGPDLSTVARALDRRQLIDSILYPSREVAPQYEQHIVETKSGTTYSGVLIHTGLDGSLALDAVDVGRVRVPAKDIADHQISSLSMMPNGLQDGMTIQDFRDLLAFLLTLK